MRLHDLSPGEAGAAAARPIGAVMGRRRGEVWFRLGISWVVAGFFGPTVGWSQVGSWCAIYAALQAIEITLVRPDHLGAWRGGLTLLLLVANTTVFGAVGPWLVMCMNAWGGACAVLLLMGALFNTVLTTIGCRAAFVASAAPIYAYLLLLPLFARQTQPTPEPFVIACLTLGGVLLSFTSIRLWSDGSRAQAAEAAAVRRDMAAREANEARLYRMAHLDALTGLANRTVLQARLGALAGEAALLLMDLDGFKYVNDTLGHSAGDAVLREVAGRLQAAAREDDLVARLGGDEFAIVLQGAGASERAEVLADRFIAAVSLPLAIEGQTVTVGASVGVAVFPRHGAEAEALFANADLALYRAKGDGRHCSRVYAPGLRAEAERRIERDAEVRQAIDTDRFTLVYAPQIDLRDGTLAGVEATLRWRQPDGAMLDPIGLAPALESGRLAIAVEDWMLDTVCRDAASLRAGGLAGLQVGVGLFGAQLRAGSLVRKVDEALARAGLPAAALELGFAEHVVLQGEGEALGPLQALRAMGVGIALDEYGTGPASLSLLKQYPLTRLKMNRALDPAIRRAVLATARAFGLAVTAAGVATEAEAHSLRVEGCAIAGGPLFGAALSLEELRAAYAHALA